MGTSLSRVRLRRELLLLGLVLALAVAGSLAWQWWARHRTVAPLTPLGEQCGEVPGQARRVTFDGADGTTIGAAALGSDDARTVVVLRHGASQTLCDWLPWAADVESATDAQVLLFDRRGRGSTPADPSVADEPEDLARAVALLTGGRDRAVVLVASSMGNAVQLSALDLLPEPPCALVAVSPVLRTADDHGRLAPDPTALPHAAWPDHLWVAHETGNQQVSAYAAALTGAGRSADARTHALPVDTDDHSRQLVEQHPEVQKWITDAVATCS